MEFAFIKNLPTRTPILSVLPTHIFASSSSLTTMMIGGWLSSLSLLHFFLSITTITSAFEVPFPQSSAEIRASISGGGVVGGSDSFVATPPTQTNNDNQPITRQIQLGSGTLAEVISCIPPKKKSSSSPDVLENIFSSLFGTDKTSSSNNNKSNKSQTNKPTLAFLHGSFHASWCWAEKYMPYFASLGYPCVAFSLQGTGGTPTLDVGAKKVKIASHVADLDAFLKGLSDDNTASLGLGLGNDPKIVLIGHSFGGLTIMKWLEQTYGDNNNNPKDINLAGVGLICSVPPSGNGKMTMRFIRRSLRDAWKITAGFVMKKAITDKAICRDLFFGGTEDNDNGISDEDIERYQSYFQRDTVATIDLGDLAKQLPSALADKETGRAPFVDSLPPVFVIGASEDFIVDREGVDETARYMGLDEPLIVDSPHDVMIGRRWKNGADAILEFVDAL
jgi:pimeloyl-ACP methyl ester carboxylesterase